MAALKWPPDFGKLFYLSNLKWSRPSESNRRPFDYESNALPTELGWLIGIGSKPGFQDLRREDELQNIRVRYGQCQAICPKKQGERPVFRLARTSPA